MSKANGTMKVQHVPGEMGVFRVESWDRPDTPHTVDLLDHQGQGSCTCTDWSTRCRPNQKKYPFAFVEYGPLKSPNPNRHACRHVTIARKYFLREILQGLAREHRT
jgi:hypothetical protein